MKKQFEVKGLREQRAQEIASIILMLMIQSLIIGIVLIILVHNDVFSVTLGSMLISPYIVLIYRFNFTHLSQFIVDYEYSVNNFYEIENIQIQKKMNETKILKDINVFQDIGFDSPDLTNIRDIDKTTLQLVWGRNPDDKVPSWNGLTIVGKYAVKMALNRMN
jgi:hypothetical protein